LYIIERDIICHGIHIQVRSSHEKEDPDITDTVCLFIVFQIILEFYIRRLQDIFVLEL